MATTPRKPRVKNTTQATPWDSCRAPVLTRECGPFGVQELDPGVNFFVLALEALGAKTRFSCEGHPTGFYVAFEADYALALEIRSAGFFTVEIEGHHYWSIRRNEIGSDGPFTDKDRVQALRWASSAWVKRFGDRLGPLSKM